MQVYKLINGVDEVDNEKLILKEEYDIRSTRSHMKATMPLFTVVLGRVILQEKQTTKIPTSYNAVFQSLLLEWLQLKVQ
ncbi:hypothetical protein E2C01_053247 [Portunus trituberculatus]|uniref:Uncharacterized protein n=1 Tax=Portunus trituberculatus TaxID=210409 RepID=A0A5B7GGK2_PORTR|nr:hypothetical protein [Portunus trituberculatus]